MRNEMDNMRMYFTRADGIYKVPTPYPISPTLIQSLPPPSANNLEVRGWLFDLIFHSKFASTTLVGANQDNRCEWEILSLRKAPWNGQDLRSRSAKQMVADVRIDYHGDSGEFYDREDNAFADRIVLAVKMALHLKGELKEKPTLRSLFAKAEEAEDKFANVEVDGGVPSVPIRYYG